MKAKHRQSGVTLMEMTVVITAVAILTTLSMPAVHTFFDSLGSAGSTKAMIGAALSAARATAIKEHRYAGIRFQKAYCPKGPLEAPQYMIFIVHDPADKPHGTNLNNGFRAVENLKPVKLPETIGVMDIDLVGDDMDIDGEAELTDTTAFSILFSPSGKLVVHKVQVRNRDGDYRPDNGDTDPKEHSMDDIFNSLTNIKDYDVGIFVQDDYPNDGLEEESSRTSFIIYDRTHFNKIDVNSRWSDYLSQLEWVYINPYTGTIVNE